MLADFNGGHYVFLDEGHELDSGGGRLCGCEFAKGFATYDILPGFYIALKTGLTILDLNGNPITSKLDLDQVFVVFRKDAKHPQRTSFVAAKNPALAEQVVRLLKKA